MEILRDPVSVRSNAPPWESGHGAAPQRVDPLREMRRERAASPQRFGPLGRRPRWPLVPLAARGHDSPASGSLGGHDSKLVRRWEKEASVAARRVSLDENALGGKLRRFTLKRGEGRPPQGRIAQPLAARVECPVHAIWPTSTVPPASACEPRAWRRPADLAAHRKDGPRTSAHPRLSGVAAAWRSSGRGCYADYRAIAVMMGSLDFGPSSCWVRRVRIPARSPWIMWSAIVNRNAPISELLLRCNAERTSHVLSMLDAITS